MARAAAALPRVPNPRVSDILREGLAEFFLDGNAAAVPTLRRAVEAARRESPSGDQLSTLWQVGVAALHIWDDEGWKRSRRATSSSPVPPAHDRAATGPEFAGGDARVRR